MWHRGLTDNYYLKAGVTRDYITMPVIEKKAYKVALKALKYMSCMYDKISQGPIHEDRRVHSAKCVKCLALQELGEGHALED